MVLVSAVLACTFASCRKPAAPAPPQPVAAPAPAAIPPDIVALFDRACIRCHGPERSKAGLRIDRPSSLAEVISPGDPDGSVLIRRIEGKDGEDRMPLEGAALPDAEVARLRAWIKEGAAGVRRSANGDAPQSPRDREREILARGTGFWSYQPLRRPPVPEVQGSSWPRNDIDRFILAALARAGSGPSPEADAATLLRRVSIDLVGLPPSPEEVDAFVAEARAEPDQAYRRAVDRLLASPHHGERWAVPWLDAARYADTNGYEKDARRPAYRYRDWVVAALNADLPFDRFTAAQLAGDLLPDATDDTRTATGFLRGSMTNEEGGVDPGEARFEEVIDRTSTVATVWLGSTLACARCHDHKHDPFTQRDFYALLAYFEHTRDVTLELPTPEQAARRDAARRELDELERSLGATTPERLVQRRDWEASVRNDVNRWVPLERPTLVAQTSPKAEALADGSLRLALPVRTPDVHTIEATLPASWAADAPVVALRLEALPDPSLPQGGPGTGPTGNFFVEGVDLAIAPARGAFVPVPLLDAASDDVPREEAERYDARNLLGAARAGGPDTRGPSVPRGWGVWAFYDEGERLPRQLVLVLEGERAAHPGTRVRLRVRYGAGARGEVIGRVRLSATADRDALAATRVTPAVRRALARAEAERTPVEAKAVAAAFRATAPALAAERERAEAHRRSIDALGIEKTLAVGSDGARGPLTTNLRVRGAYAARGAEVLAALPAILCRPEAKCAPPSDRLALARWLTSTDNPLTARVIANRLWADHFGRGLVETPEDFGTSGARPSHAELLDWLASELVASGWRLKHLHRLIVTSAAYRQSSSRPAEAEARDPENRLYARAPRFRLDAEAIRDGALAVAGLLDLRVGGSPVFPPQPEGVWALPNSADVAWPTSPVPDRHRRSFYTFWRRTAPYPSAQILDAPSRETCVVRRDRTVGPLQALVTLNDGVYWEAARALAVRARREAGEAAGPREWIARAHRLVTTRAPDERTLGRLLSLYQRRLGAAPSGDASAEALALVASTLLNLHEFLTRT